MLTDAEKQDAADALLEAWSTGTPCALLSKSWPAIDVAAAYDIQARVAEGRGVETVGYKIGLTNTAIQNMKGAAEPSYGVIFADRRFHDGVHFDPDLFIAPRVEVELAFVMGADLSGAGCQVHDVLAATEMLMPAFEIVDSRTEQPSTITDLISDNTVFGAIVTGGSPVRPFDVDPRWLGATLARNGEIVDSGVTAAIMGHPAAAVAWLVNRLADTGGGLSKGDLVLSGSVIIPPPAHPGDVFTTDWGPLGSVSVRFDAQGRCIARK